jgi:hypothetical protein
VKISGVQDVDSCGRCIVYQSGHNSRVLKRKTVVLADAVFCTVVTPNSKDDKCNVRCAIPDWESVGEDFLIYVLHIPDWNWRVLV